jgi:GDP-mannose 6-dehydrogenase
MRLYDGLPGEIVRTCIETAEMVKYADNTWHALKVTFANEIGAICRPLGIDSHRVMQIFCQDTKLNLSPYYLRPGFAFGGSCLPKDVRALNYKAKSLDVPVPVIASILESNNVHIDRAIQAIIRSGRKRIGILGFAFKAGTDDLRESPIVEVIERLIGKGFDLRLYDRSVNMAALTGANRDYILNHIPHISRLMCGSMQEVMNFAETVVIGNPDPEFATVFAAASDSQRIVDLVRVGDRLSSGNYEGICW